MKIKEKDECDMKQKLRSHEEKKTILTFISLKLAVQTQPYDIKSVGLGKQNK